MATDEFLAGYRAAVVCLRNHAATTNFKYDGLRDCYENAADVLEEHEPDAAPEALVLHCPKCGKLHLDQLEPDGTDWAKRPHKTHLCKNTDTGPNTGCGHLWRPKETPTVGVAPPVEAERIRLGVWLAAAPARSWSRTNDPKYFWITSTRGCWGGTFTEALDQAEAHDAELAATERAERERRAQFDAEDAADMAREKLKQQGEK